MGIIMSYVEKVYQQVVKRNPNEPEIHQAVKEVLESLEPVLQDIPSMRKLHYLKES
jgi:glutamate dehydrogenase (NADP+)